MKVQTISINNNYYRYRNPSVKNRVSTPVNNITFNGFFDKKEPSLQDKFDAGLSALGDEKSILVVTNDKDMANFHLKDLLDNITIPVENMYTLEFSKIKDDDYTNFVIFKKDNNFNILNINPIFSIKVYNPKTKKWADTDDVVERGTIKFLKDGEVILKRGISCDDDKTPLTFTTPRLYNKNLAKTYLECKSLFDDTEKVKRHNKATIFNFLAPAKKTTSKQKEFTFADIGGLDDIIKELRKYVLRPINAPQVYETIRLNKGILLSGPPRCGKTLLGKALANEAGINFKYMNANEFTMSTHGSSEEKARNVFEQIMKEPTILFIDELDAIGKARGLGGGNAHYDDKFLTQLLGLMSDLEKSDVLSFVIAATNRKDLLDRALIDTGRFGLHLDVPLPNEKALEEIYNVHAKKQPFEDNVDVKEFIPFMLENNFNGSDVAETITNAFFNTLERLGLNAKIDAKTFTYEDKKLIKIAKEDIWAAMKKLATQKAKSQLHI